MLDRRSRIYALESWTVEKKARGWFIKRTYSSDAPPAAGDPIPALTMTRHLP
jgi:hypothetical protein